MQKAAEAALDCIRSFAQACLLHAVTLAEFLDTSGGIDDLLLAGIERMAGRADFDVQLVLASVERVTNVLPHEQVTATSL